MDVEAAFCGRCEVGVDLDRVIELERQVRRQLGIDGIAELQGLENDGGTGRVVLQHPIGVDQVVDLFVADRG